METATIKEIKHELNTLSQKELINLCLQLSKFKKENKELLTYLLFESSDESSYIKGVQKIIESEFKLINKSSYYYIKKSVRKILRAVKKYIRYSKKKETEVELLLFFCSTLKEFRPSIYKNTALLNIYYRQIELIKKAITTMHEDLQYDYTEELNRILQNT